VLTRLAPHNEPHTRSSRVAERHRRAGDGFQSGTARRDNPVMLILIRAAIAVLFALDLVAAAARAQAERSQGEGAISNRVR
jgi:hypothetical protein